MIHTSKDLSITTTHEQYNGIWNPTFPGKGFIIEGNLISMNYYFIQDKNNNHFRYMKFVVDVTLSRRRHFSANNEEIETTYQKEKLQRKGYLTKFDHIEQDDPFSIKFDELAQFIPRLSPNKNEFVFLCSLQSIHSAEFKLRTKLKLKTCSDSQMIESITTLSNEKFGNYYGENVIDKWDDKIINHKKEDDNNIHNPNTDGCDDDEWD